MLPFLIPPEQFIADINGASRLFVYEQHTSKRIIYFSPEQKSGETAGEPVKQLAAMLEQKSRFEQLKADSLDYQRVLDLFSEYSRNTIRELENEKKVLKGTYCHRKEIETDIESFFSSDSCLLFLAAEAGSGKTNTLAETARASFEDGIPALLLRAIWLSEDGIEESLRSILNLDENEDIADAPFLAGRNKAPVRIILDGLNEHKNPKLYLDSVHTLLQKLPQERIRIILSWRTSGLSELPELPDGFERMFYRKSSSYALQLSPMTRVETAVLWDNYCRHHSKLYKPQFSLEDIEQRDRVFTASLSNPLLLRMFMELYNRKKLPSSEAISLWPEWYRNISGSYKGASDFLEAIAGEMYKQKTLALEFDSLFDNPKTSEQVRELDINSAYRRLLAAGILSLFFKEGILYLSFTVEAAFHYILSVILAGKMENGELAAGDLTSGAEEFPPRIRAAAILLRQNVVRGETAVFSDYCLSDEMLPAAAAEAAIVMFEKQGAESVRDLMMPEAPKACAELLLEADFYLEKRLDTDLRMEVFSGLYERRDELAGPEKMKTIYRYCLISHEAGDYELELRLAEEYEALCTEIKADDGLAAGFADMRIATALRKLMRNRDESEVEDLGRRAFDYGRRAVERLRPLLPDNSPIYAQLWDLMAKIHEYREEWEESVKFGKMRLEFIKSKLGKRSPLIASAYNNTAISIREMDSREESVEFSRLAMQAVEENLDPNHIEMAYAHWTLANTRAKFGEPAEALEEMNTVLSLLQRLLPDDHPNIRLAKHRIAELDEEIRA